MAMKIIRAARLDPDRDSRPQDSRLARHFPWRCILLRFWEAELRAGLGAGGPERGGAVLGADIHKTRGLTS